MKNILRHLFLPGESNNYRARILHPGIILTLILFFFSSGLLMSTIRSNFPSVLGTFSNIASDQLLAFTNEKRKESGVSPLVLNNTLSQAASNKASDMFNKDYWAHNAPDGTAPWVFIKSAGYNYVYAGENLARGFNTSSDVVNAWMESPDHRKNMLSANYNDVGFAISTGKLNGEDTVLVVEMFGSTYLAPAPVAKELNEPVDKSIASGSSVVARNTNPETLGEQNANSSEEPKTIALGTIPSLSIKPLIDSQSISLMSARIILFMIIFVLILDMVIIERKKIVRFVGHNLDHVFFFSLIFILIIILTKGSII